MEADGNYMIERSRNPSNDQYTTKAWLLAAKTMYPNDFKIQFEAYLLEKNARNFKEAGASLSYIMHTFNTQQHQEFGTEVTNLTTALHVPDDSRTSEQEFFVKMFHHIPNGVQKIILLSSRGKSDLDNCKFILMLMKRYPESMQQKHSQRLLELLIKGIGSGTEESFVFKKMLVNEALPAIVSDPPDLPPPLLMQVMSASFEYYIQMMALGGARHHCDSTHEHWAKIFELLEFCGCILKWETFLPYNKKTSMQAYWQKVVHILSIVSARPIATDNNQILFYATVVFLMSLESYMFNRHSDQQCGVLMLEGFTNRTDVKRRKPDATNLEAPTITPTDKSCQEKTLAFVAAEQCYKLLNSNEFLSIESNRILYSFPMLKPWINRFLLDCSIFVGHPEGIHVAFDNFPELSPLERNMIFMSSNLLQHSAKNQAMEYILKILTDLPMTNGEFVSNITVSVNKRHLIMLPLTKRAVIQYCTEVLINLLKSSIFTETVCPDIMLGNMLVLLQLDYPQDRALAETIFEIIKRKGHFAYQLFSQYIINIDLIEEFMHVWQTKAAQLELSATPANSGQMRRIGTRGADKGVKEDFKQIIRQQVAKCNDEIDDLIVEFITKEHRLLMQFF